VKLYRFVVIAITLATLLIWLLYHYPILISVFCVAMLLLPIITLLILMIYDRLYNLGFWKNFRPVDLH
jgi:hypothetical protein